MKKFLLALSSIALCSGLTYAVEGTAERGDILVEAGIGVGMVDYPGSSGALFTQRVGVEYVVLPTVFTDDFTFAVGLYVNNGYGAPVDGMAVATYNYTYPIYSNGNGQVVNKGHREGVGTANATFYRDDVNILPTASLRYHCTSRLDAYVSLGFGIGVMNTITGKKSNYQGFESANHSGSNDSSGRRYSYNDLDHAKWENTSQHKACFATSFYLGARYALTENWGVNAQFGLIGANARKSWGNSYNLFSIGATYNF